MTVLRSSPVARRRALLAVCAGNAMEWYDFAPFAGSATVIAAALTPGGWAGFTAVVAVFAMSCLFRPLGSLLIGVRADRTGRRSTLAATILLMAGATAAIGLLPSWAAIGVLAPLCLLALRAVEAISAGGEIGVSVAYLSAAPGHRAVPAVVACRSALLPGAAGRRVPDRGDQVAGDPSAAHPGGASDAMPDSVPDSVPSGCGRASSPTHAPSVQPWTGEATRLD